MMKFSITFYLFLVLAVTANAQTVYTNFDDFKDAASALKAGDEIILANGSYNAESIKLDGVAGTIENPVIIRAQEVGKVILNDEAFFDLRHSSYVTIEGFVFKLFEKSTTFKIQTCNNIRITQNVFDGSNEPSLNDDGDDRNSSVWISIQSLWDDATGLSHHNRIDHNVFLNKHTLGNMIKIDGTDEKYVSQYDVIEYNHFKNMGPRAENEMEVIRIGWSAMSESDGYTTVSNNLFEACNGDPEIISVKCNKNTISHNTFRRCQGTLSLRHGNESLVEGNFFFGEGAEGTGGVRIYGSDHKIINNYFHGLTGTKWDAPITLTEGDAEAGSSGLSKHFRIERAIIANNTIVNCDYGIEVGYNNVDKYSKPPRNVTMAYNVVSGTKNALVNYINVPDNMTWIDNILFASDDAVVGINKTFTEDEAQLVDPVLVYDSVIQMYAASSSSPGYNNFNNTVGTIETDFQGQPRTSPFNYGCDEYDVSDPIFKPLNATDVGVSMREYISVSQTLLNLAKEATVLPIHISSNLAWRISEDVDWLSLAPQSGLGDAQITVHVLENNSGQARSATITIESTNAKDQNITKTIRINQSEKSDPFLSVSTQLLLFSKEEEEMELSVSSNIEWSIICSADWIEIDQVEGEGDAVVSIKVRANQSIVKREAVVAFSNDADLIIEVTVVQEGLESTAEKLPIISAVASTEQADKGNVAANVIDGDLDNRWSGEGDGAFITLDLGELYEVSFLKVGLYKGNERNSMFDILTSTDNQNYSEASSNITSSITDEDLVIYDFDDVKARYVRIVGHGNSSSEWNSYTEFEVWGWTNTAASNMLHNFAIDVYPNPFLHEINIDNAEGATVSLFNTTGKCCFYKERISETQTVNVVLPLGVYTLKIEKGNAVIVKKMIVAQ